VFHKRHEGTTTTEGASVDGHEWGGREQYAGLRITGLAGKKTANQEAMAKEAGKKGMRRMTKTEEYDAGGHGHFVPTFSGKG